MPFLSGYTKRKALKYGTVFPGSNLTGFPKWFPIAGDTDIAAALASGGGIAVTLADGTTQVPFGLYPSSNPASGNLLLRAKFDPLTAATTGDVMGYLYYDATATTVQDRAGVASGYKLFMPMEQDPSGSAPQERDWVTDTLLGTSAGSMTSGDLVAATVSKGIEFDGVDDRIALPGRASLVTDNFTIEAVFHAGPTSGQQCVAYNGNDAAGWGIFSRGDVPTQSVAGLVGGIAWVDSLYVASAGEALHVAFRRASGVWKVFVNGVDSATSGAGCNVPADFFEVGHQPGATSPARYFGGVADEVAVSEVARSDDWLAYSYQDQFHNADTWTLGVEEFSAPLEQEGFRFRNDDGSETTASWLNAQDASISQPKNTNTRLRVLVNQSGDLPGKKYQLEYRVNGGDWKRVENP